MILNKCAETIKTEKPEVYFPEKFKGIEDVDIVVCAIDKYEQIEDYIC